MLNYDEDKTTQTARGFVLDLGNGYWFGYVVKSNGRGQMKTPVMTATNKDEVSTAVMNRLKALKSGTKRKAIRKRRKTRTAS